MLLINPPVYDFSAYDFWLKPYGMLRVAGMLRDQTELRLFDYMDRLHSSQYAATQIAGDPWGRGEFDAEMVPKPQIFSFVSRKYKRFGLSRGIFQSFLAESGPFDFALIQTTMTYWYPGVREVIEDIRTFYPQAKIVLGGVYATLCTDHAQNLGADLVVEGLDLQPLWRFLNMQPNPNELPFWEDYPRLETCILKLADGCPFKCTYCSVPQVYPGFSGRPLERSLAEFAYLRKLGVRNIAFYDDALLFQPERILVPFLKEVLVRGWEMPMHLPNALNARFITPDLARLMVKAGLRTFYMGFESSSYAWQKKTGGKVYSQELVRAVENLVSAGADTRWMTAYIIVGHPEQEEQNMEESMRFANSLGLRVMLSEFSPIPGTPDGEKCRAWVDLDEPLWHNKTVFPMLLLGEAEVERLKGLCRDLNRSIRYTQTVIESLPILR